MAETTEIPVPNLTVEFVSKIIGKKVESFTINPATAPGDNYSSVLYTLRCILAECEVENGDKEIFAISKNYPSHPMRQHFLNKSNMFWNELEVYNTWIPELRALQSKYTGNSELPFPPLISGEAINFGIGEENKAALDKYAGKVFEPFDIYIMMVDMRNTFGFRMAERTIGLGLDELTLVIKEYSRIHSLSWAYKVKNELPDLCVKFPFFKFATNNDEMDIFVNMIQGSLQMAQDALAKVVKAGEEGYMNVIASLKEKLKEILETAYNPNEFERSLDKFLRIKVEKTKEEMEVDAIPWKVVVHGDCWINNLMFRYDPDTNEAKEMVLVDLQMMREACPTSDLAYCLYSSVSPEFRKKHLQDMLKLYADQFMMHCDSFGVEYLPGFSYEALKRRFHSSKIIGAMTGILVLPILLKDAKDAVNMDTLEVGEDFLEMFSKATAMGEGNTIYQQRIYGLAKELYEDGIL